MARTRNRWGWGFEDAVIDARAAAPAMRADARLRHRPTCSTRSRSCCPSAASTRPPGEIWSADDEDRAAHALGKSYVDTVRGLRGVYEHAPDLVARPRDRGTRWRQVLAWAAGANAAVIPYGGGTSVVGGVEPRIPARFDGAVSLDLGALDGAARGRPGLARGAHRGGRERPARGGAAARARPHAALLPAVLRALDARRLDRHARGRALRHAARRTSTTSSSPCARSRRAARGRRGACPGSGAGPSPDRMLLGSEGILGVDHRGLGPGAAAPAPPRRAHGALRLVPRGRRGACARSSQAGLQPANCRLIDALEAGQTGAGDGERAVLVLGFESADHPVDDAAARGRWSCARRASPSRRARRASGAWRDAFIAHALPARRAAALRRAGRHVRDRDHVGAPAGAAPRGDRGGRGGARRLPCRVTCRLTHAYPDGAAPYFTVLAPAERGDGGRAAGGRSSAPRPTRCSRPAARSPTTTPSGAITARGTTASAPIRSPPRCAGRRPPSTPRAC